MAAGQGLAAAALLIGLTTGTTGVMAQTLPPPDNLAQLNAVLWTQQSIEHQAATAAMYRSAADALRTVAKQRTWASLEQGAATTNRPAAVLDLDETVLDNSAYNAWLIQQGKPYTEPTWQDWMALRSAPALPGALEFARLAKRLGVDLFFISNRECVPQPADPCPALTHTRENLIKLGFERAADADAFLFKKQKPEWSASDKSARRQAVATTHRIVMLLGDDMGDFLPLDKVAALRAGTPDVATARGMKQLGHRWFVIPNPMYGSWEKPVGALASGRVAALKPPPEWAAPVATGTIRIATWNLAWLANEPLSAAQAQNCRTEARAHPGLDDRPSAECRKGSPFRQLVDYERLAAHAKTLDADILGLQEVEGLPALAKVFDGDLTPDVAAPDRIAKGTYFLAAYSQGGWQKTGVAIRRALLAPGSEPVVQEFVSLGDALPRDRRGGLEVTARLRDGRTLSILAIHLKSRCVEDPLDAATDHCRQLSQQAPALSAWIAQKELARQPYVVLGDFNRSFGSEVERACSPAGVDCKQRSLAAWIDGGDVNAAPVVIATAGLVHPAGCFDTRFKPNAIEHIVFGGGAEAMLVPGSVRSVPYVDAATGQPIVDHRRAVALYSDHCVVEAQAR